MQEKNLRLNMSIVATRSAGHIERPWAMPVDKEPVHKAGGFEAFVRQLPHGCIDFGATDSRNIGPHASRTCMDGEVHRVLQAYTYANGTT